jgi:hypothetical protein
MSCHWREVVVVLIDSVRTMGGGGGARPLKEVVIRSRGVLISLQKC